MKTIEGMIRSEIVRQTYFDGDDFVLTAVSKSDGEQRVVDIKALSRAIRKDVVAQVEATISRGFDD